MIQFDTAHRKFISAKGIPRSVISTLHSVKIILKSASERPVPAIYTFNSGANQFDSGINTFNSAGGSTDSAIELQFSVPDTSLSGPNTTCQRPTGPDSVE